MLAVAIFILIYCKIFNDFGLIAKTRLLNNPIFFVVFTPLCFWLSAYLCRKFSFYAAGNSMEHIKQSLDILQNNPQNYQKISPFLSFKLVFIKAISSLICCFGGGALGSEGPSVHMSASIFVTSAVKLKKFLPKINFETLIYTGSAAGIAIAFNAPFSGFVYVAEKMLRLGSKNLVANLVWTSFAILIIALVLVKANPIFVAIESQFYMGYHLLLFILIAVFCGFLAVIFKKTNSYFFTKIAAIKSNWWHLIPIICGLLVALISLYNGIYSFSSGIQTVNWALASDISLLSYQEALARFVNTIITFISGCAGGLIAPAIAVGASIGSTFSPLITYIDINLFIIIGMTSFLAAVLGEPITAAIIIFESTAQPISSLPFLVTTSLIAVVTMKFVTNFLSSLKT